MKLCYKFQFSWKYNFGKVKKSRESNKKALFGESEKNSTLGGRSYTLDSDVGDTSLYQNHFIINFSINKKHIYLLFPLRLGN